MNPPSSHSQCPRCGDSLPTDAVGGLCPRCLMVGAMQPTQDGETHTALPPMTPEELAPHFPQLEILECLGRGGMGVVYKARQKSLNRLVALKLLAPERADDPQFAARFEKEAQALAALNHPHIVSVFDFGQASGFYYLLMEFVDGVNLRQLLQTKRLTPKEALSIVPPVCDALQCAHDHGIVHRDIKPENLLIDKSGIVKIADFGVAKILGDGSHASQTSHETYVSHPALGTPAYAAPEQQNGHADHRADIYSLGVVLYEMLTGERPREKLEAPSKRVQVDVRIDEIVLRALEKTPELRFATAAEFRTQVEAASKPADKPLSGTQSFFQRWCPASWFDKMKAESQQWHLVCDCGHATSVWDRGGIRCGASGKPMKMMSCPACGKITTHRMEWRGEGGPQNPKKGSTNALAVNAAVWVGLALAALGIVFLVEVIRDGMRGEGMVLLAVLLASLAPILTGFWHGTWLRGFAVSAFILSLPCILISGFFAYSMTQESGGWHPAPAEAFLVPLSFIGALFFPIAGITLWHGGRPSGRKMGCGGLLLTILAIMLVLFLVFAGILVLSYRSVSKTAKVAVTQQATLAASAPASRLADGFDFPVGPPDGRGYFITRGFRISETPHLGEDWNGNGGANSDLGDPIHATADGIVVFSENAKLGHGNVIIIRHTYQEKDGSQAVCESSYHHLHERLVEKGTVVRRGQKIGTMGSNGGMYPVHLHFELRKTPGIGLERYMHDKSTENFWKPSEFINAHRPPQNSTTSVPARSEVWIVEGRVVDDTGKAVPDADIHVSSGMGTLMGTGQGKTGVDGHYRVTFGPGFLMAQKDRPGALQAAIVQVRKTGYTEKNLGEAGDRQMAWELTAQQLAGGWQPGPEKTFLPGKPLNIDFVLVPAATIHGTLIDKNGQPIADRHIVLTGDRLRPGSSLYAAARTDAQGRFTFEDVSTQHAWSFSIDKSPHYRNRTPPDRFATPGEHHINLEADGENLRKANLKPTTHIDGTMNDEELKKMSWQEFDQTNGKFWRELADVRRFREAAELIERFLKLHPEVKGVNAANMRFHAAQCLAMAGENEAALAQLKLARHSSESTPGMRWNVYVDGTAAFLSGDRQSLISAHETLAKGGVINKPNICVLDRLLANFGKTYAEAYETEGQDHKKLSADCFNRAWELLDKKERSKDEDERMISLAHASLAHWRMRIDCADRNLSISYWQISRVYAVLGQGDNAARYGGLCLHVSGKEPPFYLAYAHEALARAAVLNKQRALFDTHLAEAKTLAAKVTDADEKKMLEDDLATLLWK